LTLSSSFWDWTLDDTQQGLPSLITDMEIKVYPPAGSEQMIVNPLATFSFGNTLPSGFTNIESDVPDDKGVQKMAYFAEWKRTCRWPASNKTANDDYRTLTE
jgi:hypothetical protein